MRVTVSFIEKGKYDAFENEKTEEFFDVISAVLLQDGTGQIIVETDTGQETYKFQWVTKLSSDMDDSWN